MRLLVQIGMYSYIFDENVSIDATMDLFKGAKEVDRKYLDGKYHTVLDSDPHDTKFELVEDKVLSKEEFGELQKPPEISENEDLKTDPVSV